MILQTPWIERKFEFNFPAGLFPVIVERIRGTIYRIEKISRDLPDEKLSLKINNEWSLKEQLGHLYDLEELWYGRLEDFLAGAKTLRAADMTNAKTHFSNHNSKPYEELFLKFVNARMRLIEKVEYFDESKVLLTALHPRLQIPMRLIDSVFFVAEHDDHHITKMHSLITNLN
jgi:uncharacterized damage-inducible protein DinB